VIVTYLVTFNIQPSKDKYEVNAKPTSKKTLGNVTDDEVPSAVVETVLDYSDEEKMGGADSDVEPLQMFSSSFNASKKLDASQRFADSPTPMSIESEDLPVHSLMDEEMIRNSSAVFSGDESDDLHSSVEMSGNVIPVAGSDSERSGRRSRPTEDFPPPKCPFKGVSISKIQRIARDARIDLSGCRERREMIKILVSHGIVGEKSTQVARAELCDWSVSILRALAKEVRIDLSNCTTRDDMLDMILFETNIERPHLRNYVRALAPLASLPLPDLRGVARRWRVNINDCLEKEEIIQKLCSKGRSMGVC